jgi:hypothetical protein
MLNMGRTLSIVNGKRWTAKPLPSRHTILGTLDRTRVVKTTARSAAYGTDELFEEARQRGATASLHKPFEMDELSPLVARALAAGIH